MGQGTKKKETAKVYCCCWVGGGIKLLAVYLKEKEFTRNKMGKIGTFHFRGHFIYHNISLRVRAWHGGVCL